MSDTEGYAASVVQVLRDHFPDLADPATAGVVTDLIARHVRNPQDPFEVIVDDPISARWRLKAKPGRDRGRVRLRCYRLNRRQSDDALEEAVNDALRALDAATDRETVVRRTVTYGPWEEASE